MFHSFLQPNWRIHWKWVLMFLTGVLVQLVTNIATVLHCCQSNCAYVQATLNWKQWALHVHTVALCWALFSIVLSTVFSTDLSNVLSIVLSTVLSNVLSLVFSTMMSTVFSMHTSGCSFLTFWRFNLDPADQPDGPQYEAVAVLALPTVCVCVCVCVCAGLTVALDSPFWMVQEHQSHSQPFPATARHLLFLSGLLNLLIFFKLFF
jgi:hypothetical protein